MAKVKPVTPEEATKSRRSSIPDAIIQAVNEILMEKFDGSSIRIKWDDIIELAISIDYTLNVSRSKIFDNGWMDIEPIFEKFGWKVEYDKPGCRESYDPYFKFTKNK